MNVLRLISQFIGIETLRLTIFIFSFIDIFHLGLFKVLRVLSRRLFNPLGLMLPCMVEAFDPCYTSWKHHQLRLDQEPNPNPIESISCTPSQVETSETWLLHQSLGHSRLDPHLRPSWLLPEQPLDQPIGSCFQQEVHRLYCVSLKVLIPINWLINPRIFM